MGKAANFLQFLSIVLVLLASNLKEGLPIPISFFVLVAVVTAVSGLHYVYKGLKVANSESV